MPYPHHIPEDEADFYIGLVSEAVVSRAGANKLILAEALYDHGVTEPVDASLVTGWVNNPDTAPGWFISAHHKAAEYRKAQKAHRAKVKAEQKAIRREQRREKQERFEAEMAPYYPICPKEAATVLGLGNSKQIALMMQEAGVDQPIDVSEARQWRNNPKKAPDWLIQQVPMDAPEPYGDYRPEPNGWQKERIRRTYTSMFEREISAATSDLDTLRTLGEEHAALIAASQAPDGPFVRYLHRWLEEHPETDRVRSDRLTANYLRHTVLSYDRVLQSTLSTWYMPYGFPNQIWAAALDAIVDRYPELESAKTEGLKVREAYRKDRQAFRHPSDFQRWPDAEEQREIRRTRSEENAAEVSSGKYEVGQMVRSTRHGCGVVVKKNKVTVKVRWQGPEEDPVNESPYWLTPIDTPEAPNVGQVVSAEIPRDRVRDVEVLEVSDTFMRVGYTLANRQRRERWLSVGALA